MQEFRFENVRLGLAEGNRQLRQGIKSALYQEGFREIEDASSFDGLARAVEGSQLDVAIADVALPGGDLCELIHKVRHHQVGNNPFMLFFTLTATPTHEQVRRVVDSGSDDLVVKPVSPEVIIGRLKALARSRRPFVVTHDYIGPDRRREPREGKQQVPLLEVPNPLRSKAVANADRVSLQRMIDSAAARINEQKMERYAAQVGYLVHQTLPYFTGEKAPDDTLLAHIDRLSFIAEDLGRRMRGTQYAHVAELALSLMGVAGRIRASLPEPDHRDVELLPKIANALARAFTPEEKTVEAAHRISESVQTFARRAVAAAGAA